MNHDIARILREKSVTPYFQPIVDLRGRRVLAHEALIRGPVGSDLHSPVPLFAEAARCGCHVELELVAIEIILARASAIGFSGRLFLNLSPHALLSRIAWPEILARLCSQCHIEPSSCVLELTERSLVDDYARIRDTLAELRHIGFDFAIDDLGAGYSGLRMWSELRPEFVKIDQYFIAQIESDPVKMEFVRAIVAMGRAVGSFIIAEGVETREQCRELMDLDVDGAQGYLFARPAEIPADRKSVLATLRDFATAEGAATAEQLIDLQTTLSPRLLVKDFVTLLYNEPERPAFPVVENDGTPVGIIWRDRFLLRYSRPLQPELLRRKPISDVMDDAPLIIDSRLRLEQVSQLVTRHSRKLGTDQFIVTRDGVYAGVGYTLNLLERITQDRVRIAAQSNPLTLLPGNIPINDRIGRLILEGRPFVVCYADLDNFKAFNDEYGFTRGDQLLMHLAKILQGAIARPTDFLGHIGGDDFIVMLRSTNWRARLRALIREFESTVRLFYDEKHRHAGGLDMVDRIDLSRNRGFVSLSVAILNVDTNQLRDADAISDRLRSIKRESKARPGSCLLVHEADGFVDLLQGDAGDASRHWCVAKI
jgi:EAL domain-containing protein (putative c-di-GMP-specific phosphodiesterase class I)/GGDEF domain-containing protein